MIKYIVVLFVLSSCTGTIVKRSHRTVNYPEKIQLCVSRFLDKGVGPEDALYLCQSSFRREDSK